MFQLILKAYQEAAVMSALGQKQTSAAHKPMSALPLKADMCAATGDVCYGPEADIAILFEHLARNPAAPA